MDRSLFRYIRKHSAKRQLVLLALTVVIMPITYITLELPKMIVNRAIEGDDIPATLLGFDMDQVRFLFVLCIGFLLAVIASGLLKYRLNVLRGMLGEDVLRSFRFTLYEQVMRFPLPRFKHVSQGEIIPMITSETEPLGEFIGDSYSLPSQQGGLLLTYLIFIFMQNFWLGLAAISLYPFQMWLIPKLQRAVNLLAKERVKKMRVLAGEIGETVSGIAEIHGNDTSRFERSSFNDRLGDIYTIRFSIFKKKFFIKFLNNFIAQLTPFFFYLVGGYFVIRGELSLGSLIAVLAAYKDLSGPWKELLRYYQRKEDLRVKYLQIVDQFTPEDLIDQRILDREESGVQELTGSMKLRNVSFSESETSRSVRDVSFDLALNDHVQIRGDAQSGKSDLARLLARLYQPSSGSLLINGQDMSELPESTIGRRIAYVGLESYLFTGTVMDNILYGLQHSKQIDHAGKELVTTTDLLVQPASATWVDYQLAGADSLAGVEAKILELVDQLEMSPDLFRAGMGEKRKLGSENKLAASILSARARFLQRLRQDEELRGLVEPFNNDAYNTNMTVGENLLFGNLSGERYDQTDLHLLDETRKVLAEVGLDKRFLEIGYELAELMVELFAGVEPGSPIFDQFSFIKSEDLAEVKDVLARRQGNGGKEKITEAEQNLVRGLPFQLVVGRHRLGLIDDDFQAQIVEARARLAEELVASEMNFEPLGRDSFQQSLTVQDNIAFGKIVYGQANAEDTVNRTIIEIVEELGIKQQIVGIGLGFQVGVGGSRLNPSLRQRVALCRALLKRPDILIVSDGTNAIDGDTERKVLNSLKKKMHSRCLVFIGNEDVSVEGFHRLISLRGGKLVESSEVQ